MRTLATIGWPMLLAVVYWFLLFSPASELSRTIHGNYFWVGMTGATSTLALVALFRQKGEWRRIMRFESRYLAVGIIHAAFLYGLSRLGVFLVVSVFPDAVPQLASIYATRFQLDPLYIGLLLVLIIAPFEEVFWRGFVLDRCLVLMPERTAVALSVGLYTIVHIWAFNPMLLLAALVLGAHWSYLYWKFRSLVPGLISHAAWDVLIFVILPIPLS